MYTPATITPLYLLFLISFFTFLFHAVSFISAQDDIANIGAIIDVSSRIGKEEKVSMEIAIQTIYNASSNKHKLVLHVRDTGGNPLQAYMAAEDLIEKKKVHVDAKPMVIGIPSNATWAKFVQVNKDGEDPTGFCIDVFNNARKRLYYGLPHSFKPGKYDELTEMVYNKVITN
ncbi:hypothetical protein IFM89_002437 [Coptis chinensis]|uniref:Uncharacterized protein n=1 Tax=Coptis chinensis TaxID=261450 RepID=A0A835M702_9MAGN|nr:hypothetical protein IFM89_002437 [Coptis chinensis]